MPGSLLSIAVSPTHSWHPKTLESVLSGQKGPPVLLPCGVSGMLWAWQHLCLCPGSQYQVSVCVGNSFLYPLCPSITVSKCLLYLSLQGRLAVHNGKHWVSAAGLLLLFKTKLIFALKFISFLLSFLSFFPSLFKPCFLW